MKRLHKKPAILIAVLTVVVILVIVLGVRVAKHNTAQKTTSPQYQTILPEGKTATDLGGWDRISPTTAAPVYAYSDTIGDVSITVSQQPLPVAFETDTETKIADLAKSYNATDKINADGTYVYIGTSAKGPQSTIFTKNNLLILIKSQKKIDDKAWIAYIDSLKIKN